MNRFLTIVLVLFGLLDSPWVLSQEKKVSVSGRVTCDDMDVLGVAQVFVENTGISAMVDSEGMYKLDLAPGRYVIVAYSIEHQTVKQEVEVVKDIRLDFHLHEYAAELQEVVISGLGNSEMGLRRLNGVEGTSIFEGRKTEVVMLDRIIASKATNNARQVFSRVSGLNIWESDCAGIQLGVGGRGLSPNRSSNFNTRQNGIDMSADALGYPESYYAPPVQALKSIEIVRGAASLQYGTQFGGLINFVLKDAPADSKFDLETSLTYGQYDYLNSFTSVGGTAGKWSYYGFFQYRSGDCWRCNSEFSAINGYAKVSYRPTDKSRITLDYSKLNYLARQPGGLTDEQFSQDARQSIRERNWFLVDWNLFSFNYDIRVNPLTEVNIRAFGLLASREALGNLDAINRPDNDDLYRTLIKGYFRNAGLEARTLKRYKLGDQYSSVLLGARLYEGNSDNEEGWGNKGRAADFNYLDSDSLRYDYLNGGQNLAIFAENIFGLGDRTTITPGIRFEHILTTSNGYFRKPVPVDLSGNPLPGTGEDPLEYSDLSNGRSFLLYGIGLSHRPGENVELYANLSSNYKSVSFSDIRVTVPTLRIDPEISDERGYTVDLGTRGTIANWLSYDATAFILRYNDRIGTVLRRDDDFRVYRYRSNIGDARNAGLETYVEWDLMKWRNPLSVGSLAVYSNYTWLYTRYLSGSTDVIGKEVEFSPRHNLRAGLTLKYPKWGISTQISYLSDQFSDATNAPNNPPVPGAVEGTIPAYYVIDFSALYQPVSRIKLEFSLNNITNRMYFTRRATGYPGPGIIPSDGRNGQLTLSFSL